MHDTYSRQRNLVLSGFFSLSRSTEQQGAAVTGEESPQPHSRHLSCQWAVHLGGWVLGRSAPLAARAAPVPLPVLVCMLVLTSNAQHTAHGAGVGVCLVLSWT